MITDGVDLEMFETLSKENLEQIKSWDWKNKTLEFKNFFDDNLN